VAAREPCPPHFSQHSVPWYSPSAKQQVQLLTALLCDVGQTPCNKYSFCSSEESRWRVWSQAFKASCQDGSHKHENWIEFLSSSHVFPKFKRKICFLWASGFKLNDPSVGRSYWIQLGEWIDQFHIPATCS
jgi:hypothetical protein